MLIIEGIHVSVTNPQVSLEVLTTDLHATHERLISIMTRLEVVIDSYNFLQTDGGIQVMNHTPLHTLDSFGLGIAFPNAMEGSPDVHRIGAELFRLWHEY